MILNKTRKTVVSENFEFKDQFRKIQGLIGKKNPETIILKTHFGIHTFLLKFPIDVLILNNNKQVMKLKKHLRPNRVFFWNLKFDTVVELPEGFIDKSKTKLGDTLTIS